MDELSKRHNGYMKHLLTVALSLVLILTGNSLSHAQSLAGSVVQPDCVPITMNLYVGRTDATSEGQVTLLQNFLAARGYFSAANLGTGRFGPLTRAAVIEFQKSREIPATGFVGPLTRASISSFGCGTNPNTSAVIPKVSSLSPISANKGTRVTITGSGFTTSNTVLINGSVVVRDLPVTSTVSVSCLVGDTACEAGIRQTLVFTVPEALSPQCPPGMFCAAVMRDIVPGAYQISVRTDNGESNSLVLLIR
jgi:hypothetical protein